MKEVQLNIANSTKCLCPGCGVQAESACIAAKRPGWRKTRIAIGDVLTEFPTHPEAFEMPVAELAATDIGKQHGFEAPDTTEMIELYCSAAVSASNCMDLDSEKRCLCPTCAVWAAHGLGAYYYCLSKS